MKNLVERILNNEVVDISSKSDTYSLSVMKDGAEYKVGFFTPYKEHTEKGNRTGYAYLNSTSMRRIAHLLIMLADELDRRTAFVKGEVVYFIGLDGEVNSLPFNENPYYLALIRMENLFKSRNEAEKHKEEILAKFKKIKNSYVYEY